VKRNLFYLFACILLGGTFSSCEYLESESLLLKGITIRDINGNLISDDEDDWKFDGFKNNTVQRLFGIEHGTNMTDSIAPGFPKFYPNLFPDNAWFDFSAPYSCSVKLKILNENLDVLWSYPEDDETSREFFPEGTHTIRLNLYGLYERGQVTRREIVRLYYQIGNYCGYGDIKFGI
jgi:hypothetical protein